MVAGVVSPYLHMEAERPSVGPTEWKKSRSADLESRSNFAFHHVNTPNFYVRVSKQDHRAAVISMIFGLLDGVKHGGARCSASRCLWPVTMFRRSLDSWISPAYLKKRLVPYASEKVVRHVHRICLVLRGVLSDGRGRSTALLDMQASTLGTDFLCHCIRLSVQLSI